MKDRRQPINIPDSPKYFQIDLTNASIHFRRPTQTYRRYVAEFEHIINEYSILRDQLLKLDPNAEDFKVKAEPISVKLYKHAPRYVTAFAAIIGLYWSHKTKELETTFDDSIFDYGSKVLIELDDEGYTEQEVIAIGFDCYIDYLKHRVNETQIESATKSF